MCDQVYGWAASGQPSVISMSGAPLGSVIQPKMVAVGYDCTLAVIPSAAYWADIRLATVWLSGETESYPIVMVFWPAGSDAASFCSGAGSCTMFCGASPAAIMCSG